MNIKDYSEQIMQRIWKSPKTSLEDIEQNIDKEHFVKISAWILEYYGYTSAHEFLLKFNRRIHAMSIEEWKQCIALMNHSRVRGIESLVTFYGFYTNINSYDFLNELGITDVESPYFGGGIDDYSKEHTFSKLGITEQEIDALQNIWKKQAA